MVKSISGMAKIVNGSNSGKRAELDPRSVIALASIWPVKVIAAAESNSPRNIAPESPIKIRAGW